MNSYRATVHYEHTARFKELFPETKIEENLYVTDRNRFSCCGGMTDRDLALEITSKQHGIDLTNASAHYIFHDRHRRVQERQQSSNFEPVGYQVPAKLREAIIVMERNLEEPLKLPELANYLNISQRQLARLFKKHTQISALKYYINVRLDRARSLITQTELPIAEVSGACGFYGNEQFTRAYKKRFTIVPSKDRTQGRIPYQYRSYPGFTCD